LEATLGIEVLVLTVPLGGCGPAGCFADRIKAAFGRSENVREEM